MDKLEQNLRRVILPSEYAGYGAEANREWLDVPLTNRDRDAITRLIDAVTIPVEGLDDVREVGPHATMLFQPGARSPFIIPILGEVDALWQEVIQEGEVVHLASFMGHVSPNRKFLMKTARGASLVHLYVAFAYRQTIRTCANCEATYAAGHKVTNAFCTEKCRARVADVARRARLAKGGV